MRTIKLPCFDMVIELTETDGQITGGTITSALHLGEDGEIGKRLPYSHAAYDDAIDAVESLVLAHACAGLDVTSSAYLKGLETTVNKLADVHL